jgi:hypothetical protein
MASGPKRLQINTRERAVSTDINRIQAFASAGLADFLRIWLLTQTSISGNETLPSGVGGPLVATVLGGLLVKPAIGAQTLTIDPGVVIVQRPDADASADDSQAKLVDDPGVTDTAVLPWVANPAGGIRIDIVECALVGEDGAGTGTGETVIETASRDIYNPVTGAFTAATVDKVAAVRLQYRVRRGASGGGWPGLALGWCPLMVAIVPVGAATYDDVVCYDVRPLFSDYAFTGDVRRQNKITHASAYAGYQYEGDASVSGNRKFFNGVVEGIYNGRHIGGTAPAGGYNLSTNDYAVPNFITGMVAGWWHLYLAFPFGLPRWARYTATPRVPGSMRGVVIASQQAPLADTGEPVEAIAFPTNLGFNSATTTTAFRVFTAPCTVYMAGNGGIFPTAVGADGWYSTAWYGTTPIAGLAGTHTTSFGYDRWTFDLIEDVHVPVGATAVRLHATAHWGTGGAVDSPISGMFQVFNESAATATLGSMYSITDPQNTLSFVYAADAVMRLFSHAGALALPPSVPGATAPWVPHTWHCAYVQGTAGTSGNSAPTVYVAGYRL